MAEPTPMCKAVLAKLKENEKLKHRPKRKVPKPTHPPHPTKQ